MVGPEAGKWRARWLYELRLTRPALKGKKKLTQAEFADELVRKGVPLVKEPGATPEATRIAYNRFEKGSATAPDELLERIAALYEVAPPDAPEPIVTPDSLVAAAIDRQTEQIKRQADATERLLKALESLAQGQAVLAEDVMTIADPAKVRRARAAFQTDSPPEPSSGATPGRESTLAGK